MSKPGPVGQIASWPNLGPRSSRMLQAAGIRTVSQLRRHGAAKTYAMVKAVDKRASLNLLWALEAALSGRRWQDVAKHDRLRLLLAVEDCARSVRSRKAPRAMDRSPK